MNGRADFYHVDIMDGNYVKNITLSPFFIENLKKITDVPIDVHLMVNHPEDIIPMCINAGADIISFHPETANNKIFRLLNQIKDAGRRCGVVLNPATPADAIKEYAHLLDKVTVMSVDPGYAGQKFIPESLNKIKQLIAMREVHGYHYLTEIDGSCNEKTFNVISQSGVDVFIVGTSGLFSLADNVSDAWDKMVDIYQREIAA
ncbi:allulose-6-phosphate 3-epimerase [Klebsiella aerogenes KCTC 2190]|nr:allulose-6-phosphate 3-epimerase [Klebsiella aerogenes KCTC 2190]